MGIVSLELAKAQMRADDFAADDAIIQQKLEAAEEAVVRATNRSVDELMAMNGGKFPTMLTEAVLVLAGNMYDQRESTSTVARHEVPDSLQAMIKPWRKLGNDSRADEA